MKISISDRRDIDLEKIIELYTANQWSAAEKPNELLLALQNSHALFSAWDQDKLVGIGNSISDGFLVVYYPHLLVHPDYHGMGIGSLIMKKMHDKYKDFHMQMLTADDQSIDFYHKMGFSKAGNTQSMWKYNGDEH